MRGVKGQGEGVGNGVCGGGREEPPRALAPPE